MELKSSSKIAPKNKNPKVAVISTSIFLGTNSAAGMRVCLSAAPWLMLLILRPWALLALLALRPWPVLASF